MTRGKLIVIEGLDRTGKTTQTSILEGKLSPCELMKFPDRTTPIGQMINSYLTNRDYSLSDQTAHLLFSSNRWEKSQYIQDTLNSGKNIILDRYVYSGVAYSSAKGLDFDWCLSPDRGLPKPDLVIFLNIDTQSISERSGFGDERYEVADFQLLVKTQFLKFRTLDNWKEINVVAKSIDQVAAEIWQLVNEMAEPGSIQFI